MATVREAGTIKKKQLAQRDLLWPGSATWIWDRKIHHGFTTIPKTMPLILQIMDNMSDGRPVSSTYLSLWCETWDNGMSSLAKPGELAYASGFGGQRAIYTWQSRMKILHDLKFINIQPGKSGPMSNAIIWNPHWTIQWHHGKKTPGLQTAIYNALLERAADVGANDMLAPRPQPIAPVPAPAPQIGATTAAAPEVGTLV